MADQRHQDLSEVEALLATRQQLNGWLDKLEAAGAKTPPSVRDRVRADYQGRLSQIVEQLRSHSDVISDSLQGLRTQAEEFEQFRAEEQEILAEAELRFTVGEYTDEEWTRVERDASGKISGLDQELERLAAEIGRLEDVLAQIIPRPVAPPKPSEPAHPVREAARAPDSPIAIHREESVATPAAVAAPVAPPPAAAPVTPEPAPVREQGEVPEAPRFVPRGGLRNSGPARTIPFPAQQPPISREAAPMDELQFLKSMTLDPPTRGSTSHAPSAVADSKPTDRPAPVGAKTLKCGECGALNRPTEWYCERCGAELAAV